MQRRPRFLRCAVLALIVACAAAGAASAQESAGADQRRRRASGHVKRADAFKETGDYEAAAREYKRAYALVPHPVLMFNLGQVHRLNGDTELALDYYERYLAVEPNGVASAQAQEFANLLRTEIQRGRAEEDQRAGRQPSGPDRPKAAPVVAPRPRPRPVRDQGRGLRIAGLVTGAVGLAALGVGVKFGLDARAASDDINDHGQGPWPDDLLDRQADGERAERAMILLTATGAAALVTGGVLYVLGRARGSGAERTAQVGPVIAPDHVGLVMSLGF